MDSESKTLLRKFKRSHTKRGVREERRRLKRIAEHEPAYDDDDHDADDMDVDSMGATTAIEARVERSKELYAQLHKDVDAGKLTPAEYKQRCLDAAVVEQKELRAYAMGLTSDETVRMRFATTVPPAEQAMIGKALQQAIALEHRTGTVQRKYVPTGGSGELPVRGDGMLAMKKPLNAPRLRLIGPVLRKMKADFEQQSDLIGITEHTVPFLCRPSPLMIAAFGSQQVVQSSEVQLSSLRIVASGFYNTEGIMTMRNGEQSERERIMGIFSEGHTAKSEEYVETLRILHGQHEGGDITRAQYLAAIGRAMVDYVLCMMNGYELMIMMILETELPQRMWGELRTPHDPLPAQLVATAPAVQKYNLDTLAELRPVRQKMMAYVEDVEPWLDARSEELDELEARYGLTVPTLAHLAEYITHALLDVDHVMDRIDQIGDEMALTKIADQMEDTPPPAKAPEAVRNPYVVGREAVVPPEKMLRDLMPKADSEKVFDILEKTKN